MIIKFIISIILFLSTNSQCDSFHLLPMPSSLNCSTSSVTLGNPCNFQYILQNKSSHLVQLITTQHQKTFKCKNTTILTSTDHHEYRIKIVIKNPELKSAFRVQDEAYTLKIGQNQTQITSNHYVGFVRGLETFLQVPECQKTRNCKIRTAQIRDQPVFEYRALMVDSSKHFLPMKILKETIDAMMYNKMNVLHWHLTDDDSFPLQLQSHPQLADNGSCKYQRYKPTEVREFINYAMVRGVRIIPEINTPGHTLSWSHSFPEDKLSCPVDNLTGSLDVTLDKTYQLIKEIFAEIMSIFPDPFLHLGGDQALFSCQQNLTQFLEKENIQERNLQSQYRKKQRKIIKDLNPSKKLIYRINEQNPIQRSDIIHWTGGGLPNTQNPLIVSTYKPSNLNLGSPDKHGSIVGVFSTWKDLYKMDYNFLQTKTKATIMGGQAILWGQSSNEYTHHLMIWPRTSAMAQKLWTKDPQENFMKRLILHEKLMQRRGIPTSPITNQFCQKNMNWWCER